MDKGVGRREKGYEIWVSEKDKDLQIEVKDVKGYLKKEDVIRLIDYLQALIKKDKLR
jgi:hypothetical protein